VISPNTLIYCPAAISIGKHVFKNWSKIPEGDINVKMGIARSCNTFFYQVGILAGSDTFLSMARRLGYGKKSGLPLIGETPGLIPTETWFKKHEKRRIMDGDTANLSIGQGVMLASPLQVAQAMAGIARGDSLPRLSLVKQIQDVSGRVLVAHEPKVKNFLNVDPIIAETVREGMREVVNEPFGTGKRGALTYTELCGKTGTAQWGPPSQNKRLAWFAGFFPFENPRFAFAALYEGKPGEKLSGGRMAAPMISDFFEHFKKDIQVMIKPPPKAMVIEEDEYEEGVLDVEGAPRAVPVEEDVDPGLVPSLELSPDQVPDRGLNSDGVVPEQHPVRPMTPTPPVQPDWRRNGVPLDPWQSQNQGYRRPRRAIPVDEDDFQPPPLRPLDSFRESNRAIPVEE
jgi:penicillin-binding protein 2